MDQEMPPDLNPKDPQLLREQERGRRASELLEHPLLTEAIQSLRQEFQTAWINSPARDSEGRERLWHLVKLVDKFESYLKEVMMTGQMASAQIEERKTVLERMKAGINSWLG